MLRFIRNLKVRGKLMLFTALFVVAFMAAVAGAVFMINTVKVGGALYDEIRIYKDSIGNVALLKSDLNEVRGYLLEMIGERDKDARESCRGKIDEIASHADALFEEVLKVVRAEDVRTAITDAQGTWNDFKESMNGEVIPALAAGREDEARELAGGALKMRYNRFIEQSGGAADVLGLKIAELEENAVGSVRRNLILLGAVCGVILVVLFALAVGIIRSITGPLGKAIGIVQKNAMEVGSSSSEILSCGQIGRA